MTTGGRVTTLVIVTGWVESPTVMVDTVVIVDERGGLFVEEGGGLFVDEEGGLLVEEGGGLLVEEGGGLLVEDEFDVDDGGGGLSLFSCAE